MCSIDINPKQYPPTSEQQARVVHHRVSGPNTGNISGGRQITKRKVLYLRLIGLTLNYYSHSQCFFIYSLTLSKNAFCNSNYLIYLAISCFIFTQSTLKFINKIEHCMFKNSVSIFRTLFQITKPVSIGKLVVIKLVLHP